MIRFHTFLIFLFSLSQLSFRGRAAEVREPGRRLCIEIALASSRCYFVLLFEGMVTILSRHSHFQKDNGSDICQNLELSWARRMLCAKFKQIPSLLMLLTSFAVTTSLHLCQPSRPRHAGNNIFSPTGHTAGQDIWWVWSEDVMLWIWQDNATGDAIIVLEKLSFLHELKIKLKMFFLHETIQGGFVFYWVQLQFAY